MMSSSNSNGSSCSSMEELGICYNLQQQHMSSSSIINGGVVGGWLLVYIIAALLGGIIGTKVMIQLWWKPRKIARYYSNQGIRGPPYHFFIGNMKKLVELMMKASSQPIIPFSHNILPRVLPFYHHWKKLYGGSYLIWFGPTPRLTVADPVLIREIFVTKSELYEKYESHPLVKKLEGDGLLSLKGHRWAHRRKIVSPVFHLENLKLMIPIMGKTVADMLDKWGLLMSASGTGGGGKLEIEVSEWYLDLTAEVITRTIFGSSYEDGKAIYQLQSQQIVFAAESFQKVFVPGYRFLPTKRNRTTWKLDREINALLIKLINQRKQSLEEEEEEASAAAANHHNNRGSSGSTRRDNRGPPPPPPPPRDVLEQLIQASLHNNDVTAGGTATDDDDYSSSSNITVDDIVEECKSFFFAGKQTTSYLLIWTTVLLAMHPHWQQLAREEVLRFCGSRDIPTKGDIAKMKTLGMIVYEVLRLYPPTVATIRQAKKDARLGGYEISKGTELLVPILAVHHDAKIWGPDVHEFNPGRFAQGIARSSKHPTAFMPFGVGGRQCIGQNLVLLQAKLAMAMILQRFSFDLSPNYKHAPTVLLFMYPQFGAPLIFRTL